MKKLWIALLMLSLVFAFAACNDADKPGDDGVVDESQKAPNPDAPIIEQVLGDPEELQTALGIAVSLPEEYPVARYAIIDGDMAQIEFYVGQNLAMGRVAKGQHDNMSAVASAFDFDETAQIAGLSVRLRYADPDAEAIYSASKLGVADAYDAAKDVSYMVSILTDATKADLTAAMEALINGTTVE